MTQNIDLMDIYNLLYKNYGPQGWWPLKTGNKGYHPLEFDYPKNNTQRFEISIGAILTQNTNWSNVEKALNNLQNLKLLSPNHLLNYNQEKLKDAIKPSGYYNQKAKKIILYSKHFLNFKKTPSRSQLLDIWGIGPETADSILLYAYSQLHFVVDVYLKRIMKRISKTLCPYESYDQIQHHIEKNIPPHLEIYQEFHALLVIHAKKHCQKKPLCINCPLDKICLKNIT